MIEDAVAEEERCALTESVHVHLSDTFQIKYSHILSWFLPQLKSRENNVLVSNEYVSESTSSVETRHLISAHGATCLFKS